MVSDPDELRAAWRRIITDHQLDVPQLLWAAGEIERLAAIVVDLVSDLASTEATHGEVYYTWEGIVRRADGMVADIIRNVSAEDDEWTWDQQLPKEVVRTPSETTSGTSTEATP